MFNSYRSSNTSDDPRVATSPRDGSLPPFSPFLSMYECKNPPPPPIVMLLIRATSKTRRVTESREGGNGGRRRRIHKNRPCRVEWQSTNTPQLVAAAYRQAIREALNRKPIRTEGGKRRCSTGEYSDGLLGRKITGSCACASLVKTRSLRAIGRAVRQVGWCERAEEADYSASRALQLTSPSSPLLTAHYDGCRSVRGRTISPCRKARRLGGRGG